ncbi:MAG: c-type cytochrome [Hyphomicrobiales bacterium]
MSAWCENGQSLTGPHLAILLLVALALAGCEEPEIPQGHRVIDGDPNTGADLIRDYGCPACHTIPGITAADGIVGPTLEGFALRIYIAGVHPNTPDNLVRWIMEPPDMVPATAMPDMDVPEDQARHIAAYLYTLR